MIPGNQYWQTLETEFDFSVVQFWSSISFWSPLLYFRGNNYPMDTLYLLLFCCVQYRALHLVITDPTKLSVHHDVIKWKHFSRYWLFMRGIHRSSVHSPHKGQWRGSLISLIWAWTNGWANNRDVGDLKRHRAHYANNVMDHWCSTNARHVDNHDDHDCDDVHV